MARMIPFPMLPTRSNAERRLYEGFLGQLDDDYVVYHGVDWVLGPDRPGGPPEQGEADFVIAHPDDGLLVLEAKGGDLSFDPATRRWRQAGRDGSHPLGEDPFHQAKGEMHSLVRILKARPYWRDWMPSYGYGVAFPDAVYATDAHPGAPADCAIDHDDLDRLDERVREIMRHWRRGDRRFGRRGMEALGRALGYAVDMHVPLRLRFDEDERRILELTQEQAYALTYVKRRRRAAVVGPAGSGKTMLAAQLARSVADGGIETLLTCFNFRLAGDLRERTKGATHLEVMHFHDLCRRMAERAGIEVPAEPPPDDPGRRAYFEERLPAVLGRATEALGPPYEAILVDEGQDIRPGWWPLIQALQRDPEAGYFFVFADDSQNLYDGEIPADLDQVPLFANLRNTKSINEFISVYHGGEVPPTGKGPQGRPVEVLAYRDEEELVRLLGIVLMNLRQEGVPLEDIAVLTPPSAEHSVLHRRGGVDGLRFAGDPEPDTVLLCTVHGFKGLERPVIIIAELGEAYRKRLDRYLYVGGSRARSHLIVLAEEGVAAELRELPSVASP